MQGEATAPPTVRSIWSLVVIANEFKPFLCQRCNQCTEAYSGFCGNRMVVSINSDNSIQSGCVNNGAC
jgi:hypothetical protein